MTVKSVIEIDVLDEKFKAFSASFEKYKKSLNEQSKKWQEINKTIIDAEKKQKDLNKAFNDGYSALKGAVGLSASLASNMASAALSAAKWVTYGALGGGFGLGALGSSATDYRTRARIAGSSTGQLRSVSTYLEPSVPGAESILEKIEDLRTSQFESYKLQQFGGAKLSSIELLTNVLRTGGEAYKRYGTTDLAFARNPYLNEILSPQQLRAFGGLPGQEQQDVLKRLNSGQFGSSDRTNATWQRFWEQLKAAGNYIETAFLNNLKEVAAAFTSLSKAVAEAIEKILQNKQVQEFLTKDLPNAIKAFTDYLTSPEFRTDLDDFFSAMKDITEWIISTLSSLGIVKDKQLKTSPQDVEAAGGDRNKADWVNVQRKKAIDRFMEAGVPKEVAIGLAANIEAESGWNTAASNKGHYGLGQWDKSRQKDFENWKGHKLETSTYAEQMDFFLYEMHNKEKNSWNEISKIAKKGGNYQDYTHAIGQFYERFGDDSKDYARRAGIADRIAIDMYVHQKPGTDVTVGTNTLAGRK